MSDKNKIKAEVREFFSEAIARLKFAFSKVWDFLLPFIQQFMSEAGALLAETALEIVTALQTEMQGASGAEKRDRAYALIQAKLTAKGIKIPSSVIYAAIEAAVQKIKNDAMDAAMKIKKDAE